MTTPRHDATLLEKSQAYCRDLTRREAKNFYYGLKLLPEPKRSAMYALYAYMRLVDDIADDEDKRSAQQRIVDLEAWRQQSLAVLAGDEAAERRHIVWPAFGAMARRYKLPAKIFEDMIAGQRQDMDPLEITTFAELREYCYRVASVVGLASIHVWGFEGGSVTEELAIDRGIAFQLTNVLRDLREDASKPGGGRVYLPREDLERFGVSVEDIRAGRGSPAFDELMAFEIARAESFYEKSAELESRVEADSRPTLRAMTAIYHGLLQKMAGNPERVLRGRVSLSLMAKFTIAWRAMRERK